MLSKMVAVVGMRKQLEVSRLPVDGTLRSGSMVPALSWLLVLVSMREMMRGIEEVLDVGEDFRLSCSDLRRSLALSGLHGTVVSLTSLSILVFSVELRLNLMRVSAAQNLKVVSLEQGFEIVWTGQSLELAGIGWKLSTTLRAGLSWPLTWTLVPRALVMVLTTWSLRKFLALVQPSLTYQPLPRDVHRSPDSPALPCARL